MLIKSKNKERGKIERREWKDGESERKGKEKKRDKERTRQRENGVRRPPRQMPKLPAPCR